MYVMTLGGRVLPILPENLKEIIAFENKRHDTLMGERVIAGDVKLHTWTISSYFPTDGEISPQKYKEHYEKVALAKESVSFGLTRWAEDGTGTFNISTQVLFDSIEWEDRMGEPGDLYYTFKLVQFIPFGSKVIK